MSKKVDIHVGGRVRRTRLFRQMDQTDLAALIGVTVEMFDRYEAGAERFPRAALLRVAHALDVSTAFFFNGLRCGDLNAFDIAEIELWTSPPFAKINLDASPPGKVTFPWILLSGGKAIRGA